MNLRLALLVSGVILTFSLGPTNWGNMALLILVSTIASQLGGLGIPYASARMPAAARYSLNQVWGQVGLRAPVAAVVALCALALPTIERPDYVQIGVAATGIAIAATVYARCGLGILHTWRKSKAWDSAKPPIPAGT